MKKSILILMLISIMLVFVSPQVTAADRDVGYAFVLPADNNAVVSTACPAVSNSPGYVLNRIALLDPGDRPMELRAECSGLRADELILSSVPPPGGCLYDILTNYQTHQSTRLKDPFNRYITYQLVFSTSNGGPGY